MTESTLLLLQTVRRLNVTFNYMQSSEFGREERGEAFLHNIRRSVYVCTDATSNAKTSVQFRVD